MAAKGATDIALPARPGLQRGKSSLGSGHSLVRDSPPAPPLRSNSRLGAISPKTLGAVGEAGGGRKLGAGGAASRRRTKALGGGDAGDEDDMDDETAEAAGYPKSSGLIAEFGSLTLQTSDVRPMGVHFLFKLASHTFQGKMMADKAIVAKGGEPEDMPSFMVQTMIAQYGMTDLAVTYLSEMFRGLARHRHRALRLRTFAGCIGLFPGEEIAPAQCAMMMAVIDATADHLDAERAVTQVSGLPRPTLPHPSP